MLALLDSERRILARIGAGDSLSEVLEDLALALEAQSEVEMLVSILLLDDLQLHLRHGAAPSLPQAYNDAIDGVRIGPNVGSCGTAAHTGRPVYVSDIDTDPLWADYRELAIGHGLRACWSSPICSFQGRTLGTFALYYREPRSPTQQDLELIGMVTQAAALAIERSRQDQEREQTIARLREDQARLFFLLALGDQLRECNDPAEASFAAAEMLGRRLRAGRVGYSEIDAEGNLSITYRNWVGGDPANLEGRPRSLAAFSRLLTDELHAGRALVVEDCHTDLRCLDEDTAGWEAVEARAAVVVPLRKAGAVRAIFFVHEAQPREWKAAEIGLIEDVARRTWEAVERTRTEIALREALRARSEA